jgi:CheY-like chemotaxis protein
VVNLVSNAGEATRGHGQRVRVTTAAIAGGPRAEGGPRACVELRVIDDGRGMDEATRARAFDPFFTTKPPGEGTGIGLATCQSIVSRAGGAITVDSRPGAGTAFRILLPAAAAELAAGAAAAAPGEVGDAAGRAPRVLLVEDSARIGELMSGVLRDAGYRVMLVATVAGALEALAGEPFGIVITDLQMPDGRGEAIVAAARLRSPEAAIVIASAEPSAMSGVDAVVMKPFSPEELEAGVMRALAQRRAATPP